MWFSQDYRTVNWMMIRVATFQISKIQSWICYSAHLHVYLLTPTRSVSNESTSQTGWPCCKSARWLQNWQKVVSWNQKKIPAIPSGMKAARDLTATFTCSHMCMFSSFLSTFFFSDVDCGENLYMSTAPSSWSDAIQAWYDEVKDFKYGVGATTKGAVIGHYTQVDATSLCNLILCWTNKNPRQPSNIYPPIIFKYNKYNRDTKVTPTKDRI